MQHGNLHHGPKIRLLSSKETIQSIESWKSTVIYGLRLNPDFVPYLHEGVIFGRKSRTQPSRELDDEFRKETYTVTVSGNDTQRERTVLVQSKEDKAAVVDLLLDQVANYAPVIPRNDIIKDAKSLNEVWVKIKQYYNIQPSGSLLNDVWNIRREFEETPQALFARMKQLYDQNLLTVGGLTHIDGAVTEDEELSPTLHNTIILHWLQVLHPDLRDLVTKRFVTQLRDSTYAAIFPEISRSVESLMEELTTEASACRSYSNNRQAASQYRTQHNKPFTKPSYPYNSQKKKHCEFCKVTNRRYFFTHNIEECMFIKKINSSASANQVEPEHDDLEQHYQEFYEATGEEAVCQVEHILNRVNIDASPILTLNVNDEECEATLDTGATCNILSESKAKKIHAKIRHTTQKVRMADGKTNLQVVGETDVTLYRNQKPFLLSAIVCRQTDTDILAGMPFLKRNDIAIRPYSDEIIINNQEYIKYNSQKKSTGAIRRLTHHTVQSDKKHIILPGQTQKFKVNEVSGQIAVEPRWDTKYNKKAAKDSQLWPKPQILPIVDGKISLLNSTTEPIIIPKHEQVCNLQPEVKVPTVNHNHLPNKASLAQSVPKHPKTQKFSDAVILNPDKLLNKAEEESFKELLSTYDEVFNPAIGRYNGKSGKCFVQVNLGANAPVQRKGRLPFYSNSDLVELQDKFDEMVAKGIMSRPQDIGVCVENIHPSFLVKKQPPSTDKRLVTDFGSIAPYCRPTPTKLPTVEGTLNTVGSFRYLIPTDMSFSYHQILLQKESQKYCGVHTPFKGLLVYNVGCMGLPGVEVALEELTSLLLGQLVKEGIVAKIADDLFIGGNTIKELRENFQRVLQICLENGITLKASKTFIAPKSVTILGWIWTAGVLTASPHKLSALIAFPKPDTVSGLKSYLGSYRFLSRVLKAHSNLLAPLEEMIKGKEPKEKLVWSESQSAAFMKAQDALKDPKAITMPRPSDLLCIVTDASVKPGAIGATLYAVRDGRKLLAGFYNCKLPEFQKRWLPCEVEALAIASALNHYAALIIQSQKKPQVLTDSKPCVEASRKLAKGEFSASARLTTFISTVSRFEAEIVHIPGATNVTADFESRNPSKCESSQCAICKFVADTMDSVVMSISVEEVIEGNVRLPFTNRNSWKAVQEECRDLRKVKLFKSQGTKPKSTSKNLKTVRKYINAGALLAHDGVLIRPKSMPLGPVVEQIIIPEQILEGFLMILHHKLKHPTANQLSKAMERYFYSLHLDETISKLTKSCHICQSIKEIPQAMIEESTEDPPATVGGRFAADVIQRFSQKILIIRESVTSYTSAELIPDESAQSISQSLLRMCNLLHPSAAGKIIIRLDPHTSNVSIYNSVAKNNSLLKSNIDIEIGRILNKNKNPVIDKGIKELHRELLIMNPAGGQISTSQLSNAIATLNSRYRRSGMSAHEMWTQRDQITGAQLPIKDRELIISQHIARKKNHPASQKSKAAGKPPHPIPKIDVGTLVYLYNDRSKLTARNRYIVIRIEGQWATLRKFTERLLGTKDITAKLNECYKVPDFDGVTLDKGNHGDSSSDEEQTICHHPLESSEPLHHPEVPYPVATSEDEDHSSESENHNEDSDTNNDADGEQDPFTDNTIQDPNYQPPANLSPAKRTQPQRLRRPTERYGEWTT